MKLSVSLPQEDVAFLDTYAHERGIDSRSAVVHKAVRLLRAAELGSAYEAAWLEFTNSGDAAIWDTATADGIER